MRVGIKPLIGGAEARLRLTPDALTGETIAAQAWVWSNGRGKARCLAQTIYGVVAGGGIGSGAAASLRQPYFFVRRVIHDAASITDPARIEALCPDLDTLVVLPWLETYDALTDEAWDRAIEIQRQQQVSDLFLNPLFGTGGAGAGAEIMPLDDTHPADFNRHTRRFVSIP